MVTQFNSTLSWLDSSESEGRAVMELVSALNEPGTLDELGIGSIRDTIADALFPGTSTIQTRARYFLFIPWILQMVEAMPNARAEQLARQLQLQLCDALAETHGAGAGVIGREARAALKRWPSSIYWVGLERWGIRREPGATPSYRDSLRGPSALLQATWAPEEPWRTGATNLRMASLAAGRSGFGAGSGCEHPWRVPQPVGFDVPIGR